jgi:FKBP-type peptidyl-prolyl cis-trans isomerase FklB
MNIQLRMLAVSAALFVTALSQAQPVKPAPVQVPKPTGLKTLKDSASYSLGFNVGQNLVQRYGEMDLNIMIQALKEAYSNKPSKLNVEMGPMIVNNYIMEVTRKAAETNKALGAKFLKANGLKKGVVTTASGLQYQVLREGKGDKPTLNDVVKVDYSVSLLNGKEVESSYKKGIPAQFAVTGVIPGWTEALQLMMPGSKYKLFVPSNLAYGDSQSGSEIPAGSTLVFEIELLEVVKAAPQPVPQEPVKNNGQ